MSIRAHQPSVTTTDGSVGSNGDCVSRSCVTPIMVYSFPWNRTISPRGFSNPITFAVLSFMIMEEESPGELAEKSRPAFNVQPTVFPKSGETPTLRKNTTSPGSFPLQSIPLLLLKCAGDCDDNAMFSRSEERRVGKEWRTR